MVSSGHNTTHRTSPGDAATTITMMADRMNIPTLFLQSLSWHLATAFDFSLQPCFTLSNQHVFSAPKKQPSDCGSYPTIPSWNSSFLLSPVRRVFHSCMFVMRTNIVHQPSSTAQFAEEAEARATKTKGFTRARIPAPRGLGRPQPICEGYFCDLMEESTCVAFSPDEKKGGAEVWRTEQTAWGQPTDGREERNYERLQSGQDLGDEYGTPGFRIKETSSRANRHCYATVFEKRCEEQGISGHGNWLHRHPVCIFMFGCHGSLERIQGTTR